MDIFVSKNSTSDTFVHSFFILTIFHSCLTIMMRACKARAPDEGGMMKKLSGQNLYKLHIFWKNCSFYIKSIHCLRFRSPQDSEPVWWNNERMQSESSGRRRNDENFAGSKLIFLIIFVTSYSLLMKLSFWVKIQSQSDLAPPPGRKWDSSDS